MRNKWFVTCNKYARGTRSYHNEMHFSCVLIKLYFA